MRGKIIAVFSVVVIVVGLLAFALMRAAIGDLVANPERAHNEADRAVIVASAQFQLDALNLQRWLSEQASDPNVIEAFRRETPGVRSEAATTQATRLIPLAAAEFKTTPPAIIAFVDDGGIAMGRDGSSLLRGDDLGKSYPPLLEAIKKGRTGSDVWVNRARGELLFASYASVRDANGKSLGAIVLGTPINDGRLTSVSEATSGRALILAIASGENVDVLAKSNATKPDALTALTSMKPQVSSAMTAAVPAQLQQGASSPYSASGLGLRGYGDGKRAALIALAPIAIGDVNSLLTPVLGATVLGIVLVVFAGVLLGTYITRPIAELEEGLLAVINGQTDRRFEIEHAEFGGLVFRINTLLNTLMGVAEDDTDEQGRPSRAPAAGDFQDAMAVDDRGGGGGGDSAAAAALRAEPTEAYYSRLYGEYIAAKKSIGDPTDHITREAFVTRIQSSEADASAKQGKAVRYKVELRGREVMLIAVPLE